MIRTLFILRVPTIVPLLRIVFLQVVEEPYTMREARIHVRHVRDLLKSIDYTDAYAGQECSSLAFLNVITQGDILGT